MRGLCRGGSKVGRFGLEVFGSSFSLSLQKFGKGIYSISQDMSHKLFPEPVVYACIFYIWGLFNLIKRETEAAKQKVRPTALDWN